ncbi:DUF4209 domain-containing protein [Microbacterium sp. NPDC059771]|uniref:DUF4209 domain-containing protein n=1 Tax=Microbacterium sp. NPDC059771 TaxID=3346941 RepID=UPI0036672857
MSDEVAEGWAEVVARAAGGGLLVAEDERPTAPDDPQVHEVILLIDAVRELMTHPDGGDESYVPIRPRPDGRWVSTHTLEDHEIEILRHVVAHDLDAPTRLRVLELLAARTKGLERVETSAKVIEHVLAEYAGRPFDYDVSFAVGRAFDLAPRFGPLTMTPGDRLEQTLLDRLLACTNANEVLRLAENLREQRRPRSRASEVAAHLRSVAISASDLYMPRLLREEAGAWHLLAGDRQAHFDDVAAAVLMLRDQAVALLAEHRTDSAARAGNDLELALDRLATIPRAERPSRGMDQLHVELTRMIRRAGTATLSFMKSTRREVPIPKDMPDLAEAIDGQELGDALNLFLQWLPLTDFAANKSNNQALVKKYPLSHLFSHVQFAKDGRTVARSSGSEDDVTYAMPSHLWRVMTREFGIRVDLCVQRFLAPSWMILSAQHPLNIADFTFIARESSSVPSGRESLVARGLHYGYGGDFLTAAHLLIPQLENIVRVKLQNAGMVTSTIEDGIETERGLSALMKGDDVERVFGPDVVFEIRALFCSAHGPNLRNEVAHGLVDDDHINSATAFYAWWFIWRLVHSAFFNAHRDEDASDSDGSIMREDDEDSEPSP